MGLIKRILKEEIKKLLMEVQMPSADKVTTSGLPILYRVGFKEQVESVFKYGYNRQFAGMAGGLMYGVGTYCNDNLYDSQKSVGVKEYGDVIFKMYLAGGYYGFIIFNERKARSIYGNRWRLEDQLRDLYNATDDEIRHIKRECDAKISLKGGSYYHGRTGPAAHGFAQCKNFIRKHQIKGVVYTGKRDGACVVPYDFGSIIPYSVSYDKGRTFKTLFNPKEYETRISKSVDVQFNYGNKYKQVFEPSAGFVMVVNNQNKYNFVDIRTDEELSPLWFDMVNKPINEFTREFSFTYKGVQFEGSVEHFTDEDGVTYNGCVLNEGEPICAFSELDALIDYINSNGNNVTENKIISESLNEDYGDYPIPDEREIRGGKMTAIYRATPKEDLDSIFKYGFNRQFAGSHVGSAFGEGTYCMTTLKAAIYNTHHGYGETVVKMYVIGGFDHFLIYNEEIAKKVYGSNWSINSQLRNIFKIPHDEHYKFQGNGAAGSHQRDVKKYGIRGMIYSWGSGYAVNVFDFSCIIPYAVYYPKTDKWYTKFNMEDFSNRINNNIDVNFRYSQKYKQVFEGVRGFVMVMNNKNKYNFIDIQDDKELSPYWFDMVNKPIDVATGEFSFTYKGVQFEGTVEPFTDEDGNTYKGCVLNEGEPICSFSELDALIDYINSQQ